MIDWLMFLFFQLTMIDFFQILTLNLLITGSSRIFYLGVRYFYFKKVLVKAFIHYSRTLFYILIQLIIVLFSMVFLPFTLFTSIFSILLGAYYLNKAGEEKSQNYLKHLSSLISILSVLIAFIVTSLINDLISIISISLALVLYLVIGEKLFRKAINKITKGIEKTSLKVWNPIQIVKLIGLIGLIAFPSVIIIYSGLYTEPKANEYFVEMRDGVKLATDVYYAPGSFGSMRPVILARTPYGKTGWAYDLYSDFYLTQHYHLVIQDLRGTYDSEGGTDFQLFTKSYQDGVDTINWLLSQNFCNGKIASVGVSALCLNQYYYAGMGPQGLEAQSLWFGTPEMFDHAIYQGSYHKSSVETWLKSTAPENWEFQRDLIFQFFPRTINFNSTSLSMPIGPQYSNVDVYGVHVGGWYDHFLQGTLDGYVGYDDFGTSKASNHQKLIMGPWTHGAVFGGKMGELLYPENANGFNLILDWENQVFDEALLGIPGRWDDARVAYYLMGDVDTESSEWNYWRYAYDWPLDHVNDSWCLTADSSLKKNDPGSSFNRFEYLYDPRFPVPNLGGQNQPFDLAGPMDQRSIEDREDVLIFETSVLTEAVEVVGRIWGHLFVNSNCTDTDFTVKITDVYPDGRSMLVCDGSLTMFARNGYNLDDLELMSGNENDVYEIYVDCWSTAYAFAPNHKIRIAISSSNYPRFSINPNTGDPLAADYLNYNIAKNSLLVGPDYPSCVIFPRLVNMDETHTSY